MEAPAAAGVQSHDPCDVFCKAIHRRGPEFPAAVISLLKLQVCPRCVLRFGHVRTGEYACAAPSAEALMNALTQTPQTNGSNCVAAVEPAEGPSPGFAPGANIPSGDDALMVGPSDSASNPGMAAGRASGVPDVETPGMAAGRASGVPDLETPGDQNPGVDPSSSGKDEGLRNPMGAAPGAAPSHRPLHAGGCKQATSAGEEERPRDGAGDDAGRSTVEACALNGAVNPDVTDDGSPGVGGHVGTGPQLPMDIGGTGTPAGGNPKVGDPAGGDPADVAPSGTGTLGPSGSSAIVMDLDGQDLAAASSTPVTPCCCVCLGVLQSMEGLVKMPGHDVMQAVPITDGAGGCWRPVSSGAVSTLAAACREEGHVIDSLALEVTLPGATSLRAVTMWRHMRRTHPAVFRGNAIYDDVTDLKEALRLSVGAPLASALAASVHQEADIRVMLWYIHPETAFETDFLLGGPNGQPRRGKRKRGGRGISLGHVASDALMVKAMDASAPSGRSCDQLPPQQVLGPAHLLLRVRRLPVLIGGYYRKLERDISNTRMIIEGKRKGRTSVEEEVQRIIHPELRCDASKFISAGREDVDVRMLGDGRPFVLEVINARAAMPPASRMQELEGAINEGGSGVEVRKLQAVTKSVLALLKTGESEKQKSYEAVCKLPCEATPEVLEKINSCKELLLEQTTPRRVEHRRAMLVRQRMIHSMQAELEPGDDPCLIKLRLRTQAGTYIKEFVHSDEGRTLPNLASLLGCDKPAEILSLDVMQIHMDFL